MLVLAVMVHMLMCAPMGAYPPSQVTGGASSSVTGGPFLRVGDVARQHNQATQHTKTALDMPHQTFLLCGRAEPRSRGALRPLARCSCPGYL